MAKAQVAALEQKNEDYFGCGGIETAHSGYVYSRGIFYVGTLAGSGGIYQKTFVETSFNLNFMRVGIPHTLNAIRLAPRGYSGENTSI